MNPRHPRFTERASRVLSLAQEEAIRCNHTYIGAEHLLLGLLREGEGVAGKVLGHMGLTLERARVEVEAATAEGAEATRSEIGLDQHAKRTLDLAADEARRLGHHFVGTEHLLLGLVREGEGTAAQVLTRLGVSAERIRTLIMNVLASSGIKNPAETPSARHDSAAYSSIVESDPMNQQNPKFAESARAVLTMAQEEAARLNHNYLGTEHILLGLTRDSGSLAARILYGLGVELNRVRSAVEFIIGRADQPIRGEIGLTPRSKKVIALAVDEARLLGHQTIGTEHLLLGLVREGEGIAAGVLESLGVNLETVRARTLHILGGDPSRASRPGAAPAVRTPRYEHLMVEVGVEDGTLSILQSPDEEALEVGVPLRVALRLLGERGWRLAGIDRPPKGTGVDHALYFFVRPVR